MSLTSIKCTSACIYTRNVYCSHQISWWHSSAYEMTFKLPTDRGCMADEGIYKMKAACICTLTLLVKSKQFFLFLWALFTDSSTFRKQKQVGFRFNTICFFIESFTVSCNENKIFAKTCKNLQVTGLWHIVTQIQCIPCTACTEYAYVFIGKGPESKIGFFVLQQYLAPLNNNQTTLKEFLMKK